MSTVQYQYTFCGRALYCVFYRIFLTCCLSSVYQPPDGVHCPDCNVCVEGYDHHCVWMGTCIGKGNYRQFLRFNLSWLLYLVFAIAWVSVIAPSMYNIQS